MSATHEDFSRRHEPEGPSDRSFGIVFAVFFALAGIAPLRRHHPVRIWALAIGVVFLILALLAPKTLSVLNRLWMRLALALSRVTTPIFTGLLFFVVFTPAGWFARLLGRDPLRLSFDSRASSYWIERRPAGPRPEDMINQF